MEQSPRKWRFDALDHVELSSVDKRSVPKPRYILTSSVGVLRDDWFSSPNSIYSHIRARKSILSSFLSLGLATRKYTRTRVVLGVDVMYSYAYEASREPNFQRLSIYDSSFVFHFMKMRHPFVKKSQSIRAQN